MEFMRCFPLTNKTQASTSARLFTTALGVLASAIRQGKEVKGGQTEKDGIKLARFADDMLVYTKKKSQETYNKHP